MLKRLMVLVMVTALFTISLAGCELDSAVSADGQKIFSYSVDYVVSSFDPTMCNGIVDNEIQHSLTEGLTRTTGGQVAPGIAERWDVSEDGTVYTFYLRDAVWSDGVPVTADDFVYSWRRLADPSTNSAYGFAARMLKGGKEVNVDGADPKTLGIRAIDDKTLEVTLANPTAYFLGYIGSQANFAPVRKDLVKKYGDSFATSPETNAYCGPFILTEAGEDVWRFEKNPDFWDAENIKLDGANVYYIEDEDTAIEMFEEGTLDYTTIPNSEVMEYRDNECTNHYLNGNVDFCLINPESNEVLGNSNFRKALNYALNRIEYNHVANNGVYKPYNAIVFPGLNGKDGVTYGESYYVDSYAYPLDGDVDRAWEYMAAAMKELGINDPSSITIDFVTTDSEINKRIADELAYQWNDVLGINVTIRQVTHSEIYSEVYPSGKYEIGFAGWGPDYNDPYTYLELWRSDNDSYTPYSNPKYDKLLDRSINETDLNKRMDLLNRAERLLIEDGALIPLQAKDRYYLQNPLVKELVLSFCNIPVDWAYAEIVDKEIDIK